MKIIESSPPSLSQIEACTKIFADLFSDEPMYQYIFPDPKTRKEYLTWCAFRKFKVMQNYSRAFLTEGEVHGYSWWIPSTQNPGASILQFLMAGFAMAPFKMGPGAFKRMIACSDHEKQFLKGVLNTPHWVLDVIATSSTVQRQGLGGKLLSPGFEEADRMKLPVYVLTHNPRNVGFYEKYGFKLDRTEKMAGTDLTAYGLRKQARA